MRLRWASKLVDKVQITGASIVRPFLVDPVQIENWCLRQLDRARPLGKLLQLSQWLRRRPKGPILAHYPWPGQLLRSVARIDLSRGTGNTAGVPGEPSFVEARFAPVPR